MDKLLTTDEAVSPAASESLIEFTCATFPTYIPEPVHLLVADNLESVLNGEIKRLMILMPPQTGKTELVSVRFPAFWLGHRPDDPILLTSHGASLANAKSWEARGVVESPVYQQIFPRTKTDQSSRAQDFWRIDGRKGYVNAAGIDSGKITGWGAKLGLIDDPFEGWEQAQSPTIREKVWRWWRGTFRTRLWEDSAVILVATRWHEDDLAGRLLAEGNENWVVLRLPAFAETQEERDENNRRIGLPEGQPDLLGREPGEALCPKRFSKETLEATRSEIGEMVWGAEYQGVPRQPTGERLSADMFEVVEETPTIAKRVRYWDKGGKAKIKGAYTCGLLMAKVDSVYFIEDVIRGRFGINERETIIKNTAETDAEYRGRVEIWVEQEPGSGGQESALSTIANLSGYIIRADRVTDSKEVRLEPFVAQAQAGNVKIKRGPWNWNWLEELCTVSGYRDQRDATAGAFNKLTLGGGGGTLHKVRWPTR